MVSAILLAAGKSDRMGEPKQILPWGKSTILERMIDSLLGSEVRETIVVLGHRADEIAERIANKPVKIVVNPNYQWGISSSLASGLAVIGGSAKGIMVVLGDQPLITAETINILIGEFSTKQQGIVVPVYRGKRGHPVIFDIKYKDELGSLTGDVGGKQVMEAHSDDVSEVGVDSEAVILDINGQDEYRRCRERFHRPT